MSTNHHTAHALNAGLTSANINSPLGELDQAITDLLAGSENFTIAQFTEAAAPSTPASGKIRVYAKTDGLMYGKDDAGLETALSNISPSIAILTDEKATTTDGGGCSATTWNARDLNTEQNDPDSIVSIASNQFTPVAGTYRLHAYAPCYEGALHRLRLYNVTGASVVQEGVGMKSQGTGLDTSLAHLTCRFTADGIDAYRIDHYTSAAQAANGLGIATDDGSPEIYLVIVLEKE